MRDDHRPHVIPTLVRTSTIADDPRCWIGETVADRYRVESVLGSGATGIALRCRHRELGLDVAVKLLHRELAAHPDAVSGFHALAQETSRLDHPNCAQVLDFGEWRRADVTLPYMATPHMQGGSLAERLDGPVPPRRALELARQVVDGLVHAHGRGLVHGHVSLRNVLVAKDSKGGELLKLVDFGLELLADRARHALGISRGDDSMPYFASPELATNAPIDARSDVYGVGLLLHHMLCGAPVFDAEDPPHLLSLHAFADPPRLPEFIPAPLAALVRRLLAKAPDKRPQTALEVARDLQTVEKLMTNRRTMQFGSFAMAAIAKTLAPVMKEEAPRGAPRPAPMPEALRRKVAGATLELPNRQDELHHPTMELRSPTTRLPDWTYAEPQPSAGRHPRAWFSLGAAALALVGVVTWVITTSEETPVRASNDHDFEAVRGVIASRFGEQSATDPAAPAPAEPRAPRAGAATELIEIDALLSKGADTAAMARIDRMLRENPDDAAVHVRRARALAMHEEDGARAIAAYDDALARDPKLLDDASLHTEVVALAKRPDLRAPALELVLHRFGAHRDPMLVELVNDEAHPLAYRDRHRALAAITADSRAADAVDRVLATTLDLWQARDADDPCLVFAGALANIERAPSPTYLGTLHRVTPPSAAVDDDENTAALCDVLPARLDAVRKGVVRQFPMSKARWTVPAAYAPASPEASADATPTAIVKPDPTRLELNDGSAPAAGSGLLDESTPVAVVRGT